MNWFSPLARERPAEIIILASLKLAVGWSVYGINLVTIPRANVKHLPTNLDNISNKISVYATHATITEFRMGRCYVFSLPRYLGKARQHLWARYAYVIKSCISIVDTSIPRHSLRPYTIMSGFRETLLQKGDIPMSPIFIWGRTAWSSETKILAKAEKTMTDLTQWPQLDKKQVWSYISLVW